MFIILNSIFSQGQDKFWRFGNGAGIDFNTSPPTALPPSAMNELEGCASVADKEGNPLFYTNGRTVWNRLDAIMPNGENLNGYIESTQSALIVPKPESDSLYYIFTLAGVFAPFQRGLNYSEVDMTLDGGLGDITAVKNVQLIDSTADQLTAVMHSNCRDVWVITHGALSDSFFVYLVTPNGVDHVPFIHEVGRSFAVDFEGQPCLKASPDGKKIAFGTLRSPFTDNFIQLFDFNNSTGEISNVEDLFATGSTSYYSLEFSPSSERLYMRGGPEIGNPGWRIYQFDLTAVNISNSATVIGNTGSNILGMMQLAPDKKIYVTVHNSDALAVINEPDNLGLACNFVENGFSLAAGTNSRQSLPQKIVIPPVAIIDSIGPLCLTEPSVNLTAEDGCGIWSGTGIVDTINGIFDPAVAGEGTQEIIYTIPGACSDADTINVVVNLPPEIDFLVDTNTLCEKPLSEFTFNGIFDSIVGTPSKFEWDFGNGQVDSLSGEMVIHHYEGVGVYDVTLRVTDSQGCVSSISKPSLIEVFSSPIADFDVEPDLIEAFDPSVTFFDQSISNIVEWEWQVDDNEISQEENPSYLFPIGDTGSYDVTLIVTDVNGCTDTIVRRLIVRGNFEFYLPNSFTPNNDGINDVYMPMGYGISSENYKFSIHNRWGEKVFETTTSFELWDGRLDNGEFVQDGVYIVNVNFQDINGNGHSKRSSIVVLK